MNETASIASSGTIYSIHGRVPDAPGARDLPMQVKSGPKHPESDSLVRMLDGEEVVRVGDHFCAMGSKKVRLQCGP